MSDKSQQNTNEATPAASNTPAAAAASSSSSSSAAASGSSGSKPADATTLSPDVLQQLKKQIEFYFSDSNFPKDKFLRAEASKDPSGYVPLATIAKFKRVEKLSSEVAVLASALADSEHVKLNADRTMVKRIAPLPEEDVTVKRSVYVKGFPRGSDLTLEQVGAVFAGEGTVLSVRLRRDQEKKFKGSAFVELNAPDVAQAAAAKQWKHQDHPLLVVLREEYHRAKKEARQKRLQTAKEGKRKDTGGSEAAGKKAKKKKGNDGEEAKNEEEGEEKAASKGEPFVANVLVRFTGVGETRREDLKAAFEAASGGGRVRYVDFAAGLSGGVVRFESPEHAATAVRKLTEDKTAFGGKVPELVLVTGEEERAYWQKVAELQQNKKDKPKKGGGRGGRGGWGGRGGRGGKRGGRGGRGGYKGKGKGKKSSQQDE